MYVVVARIRTRPDSADRYETLIGSVVAACAREACFVQFNIHRGGTDQTEFLLYEIWTDEPRYMALRGEPFFQAYLRDREALIEPPIDRSNWTLVHTAVSTQKSP
jgi:quinol monooxygenase YgiN